MTPHGGLFYNPDMPEESIETGELKESLDQGVERAEERRAGGGKGEGGGTRWTNYLSLQTAVIAVFAAVASLEAGGNSNEAILAKNEAILFQSQASDQWAYYQAKGVKESLAANQAISVAATSPSLAAKFDAQATRYKAEQGEIQSTARALEAKVEASNHRAEQLLEHHHRFAIAVTMFQIAIALSAIAALTRRKALWTVGLAVSVVGLVLFLRGVAGLL
jgi:hypothetical protein